MSHRVSEAVRVAQLIAGTLAVSVVLCLLLAGATRIALVYAPDAAPVLTIVLGLSSLAAGYFSFRWLVNKLFGRTYG